MQGVKSYPFDASQGTEKPISGKVGRMASKRLTVLYAVPPEEYEIRHLNEAEIGQAFPLVREIAEKLSIAQWQGYAGRLLMSGKAVRPESGIIVARRMGSIYLRGLCSYRMLPDIAARDRMVAGCFAVPATVDCESVARELIGACRSIAKSRECHIVQFQLVEQNRWIEPLLREAGFAPDHRAYIQDFGATAHA